MSFATRKRGYPVQAYNNRPYKRPRQSYNFQPKTRFVVTTARRPMAPPATRGYRPNTVEKKVQDLDTATYQVNTTGLFTLLSLPQLGSDFNQRIGRKVMHKSFYIKGRIQAENATGSPISVAPSQQCRMVIFCDQQPNGAAPAVTDLLVSATPASQLNLNNRDRFKIYCDKEYVFDPSIVSAAVSTFNHTISLVKKYKRINLETIFSTSTGSIADITSGALYMFWIGSSPAGSGTDANFIGSTRVRYTDN